MLNRRTLLIAIGTAAARPPYSFAQQNPRKLPRIGWLVPGRRAEQESVLEEYRRGMRELGYVEDHTVETEYLYADGQVWPPFVSCGETCARQSRRYRHREYACEPRRQAVNGQNPDCVYRQCRPN